MSLETPTKILLRGWRNYFQYGSVGKAYRKLNCYVSGGVRHFLRHRHIHTNSRGTRRFSDEIIFERPGVYRFDRVS